jgi:hypothetical protein
MRVADRLRERKNLQLRLRAAGEEKCACRQHEKLPEHVCSFLYSHRKKAATTG